MIVFNPGYEFRLAELASDEKLVKSLTGLAIDSVIRPRIVGVESQLFRQDGFVKLLNSFATCDSPKDLSKFLRRCPISSALVIIGRESSNGDKCTSCGLLFVTEETFKGNGAYGPPIKKKRCIDYLVEADNRYAESLFQDLQQFFMVFGKVTELFIHHRMRNKRANDVEDFLLQLFS